MNKIAYTGSPEANVAIELAAQAGEILRKYHQTDLGVSYKIDKFDPVTKADQESDEFLRSCISHTFPNDELLSEESPLQPRTYKGRVWMIDPLDDTKGYLAGRDTPGIMIGLIEKGRPTIGVVYLPFRDEWYIGERGKGAFWIKDGVKQRLQVRPTDEISNAILVSRHFVSGDIRPMDSAIAQLGFKSTMPEGCIGAKIGLIARGEADIFIHTNLKSGKWDTAAAHVILSEAGGVMSDIDGKALDYMKEASGWDRYFIAACTPQLLHETITHLAAV